MDSSTEARVRALLRADLDWSTLIRIATRQQVAPLIGVNLCSRFADGCPASAIDEFRTCLREITARNLFLSRELTRVLGLMEASGIKALAFKGPTLASTAYGHVGLRSFCDLDVLVGSAWDYRIHLPDVLRSEGWTLLSDIGHECTFANAGGDVHLDVHHALTAQRVMPFRVNFDAIWKRCTLVPFMGASARIIAPSDMLIMLCVQLAKDTGDEAMSPRLIKVCDIAELVASHPNLDWPSAVREARRLGVLRILCVGVASARQLLGTSLAADVLPLCNTIPRLDSLVMHVEERILSGRVGPFTRPELLKRAAWHSEIRERVTDRSALRSFMHRAVVPSSLDYGFVRLSSKRLFPLYAAVKPIRLAAKVWNAARGKVSRRLKDRADR